MCRDEAISGCSPRPRVLALGARYCLRDVFSPAFVRALRTHATLVAPPLATEDFDPFDRRWRNVDMLLTTWGAPRLDETTLARFPRLRAVFHAAGSVRPIVSEAFWSRGIPITSAAWANAIPVAEFASAAVILANKRVWSQVLRARSECRLRAGDADYTLRASGAGNYGSTVGLLSFGAIAREVRKRLRAHDLRVLVHDPFLDAETARRAEVEPVSLLALFRRSHVVSIHTPLLPSTTGLVTATLLRALPTHATLLNTSRGKIIDERGLVTVMRERPDLTAVLDVTFPDPLPSSSTLYRLPNVVLTPHLAGSLGRECERMARAALDELARFARGGRLRNCITAAALARTA